MIIDSIEIESNMKLSEKEARYIIREIKKDVPRMYKIKNVVVKPINNKYDVEYDLQPPKFERIRRITGYITGTLDSWNDSKKSEEMDRVKHGV